MPAHAIWIARCVRSWIHIRRVFDEHPVHRLAGAVLDDVIGALETVLHEEHPAGLAMRPVVVAHSTEVDQDHQKIPHTVDDAVPVVSGHACGYLTQLLGELGQLRLEIRSVMQATGRAPVEYLADK